MVWEVIPETSQPGVVPSIKNGQLVVGDQWISTVVHAAACYSPDHGINSQRIRRAGQVFKSPYGPITCVD